MRDFVVFSVSVLFLLGLGGLVFKKNLLKKTMAFSVAQSSVVLFFVVLGYRHGSRPPLFTFASEGGLMALPSAQVMATATLVLSIAVTAVLLALIVLLHRHYDTVDGEEIRRLL